MGIIEKVLDDGIEGACIILILVISYKIYKMKIETSLSCCGGKFKVITRNIGTSNNRRVQDEGEQVIENIDNL